jgi:cysteine desulfurase / selenocysteine lyase
VHRLAPGQFPVPPGQAFLDWACVGIAPRQAVKAVADFLDLAGNCPARSATAQHIEMDSMRSAARPLAASLIGAAEEDIALVESTTHGFAIAAQALPLRAGDRVLISDLEFTEVGLVWSQLAKLGIGLDLAPHQDGRVTVDMLRSALNERTRVLALSSVQWTSGHRCDLASVAQLCEERGIWLVVDAIQQLGAVPLDVSVTGADIVTCGGHKWLNAPFGTGLLYLSPRIRDRLTRPLAGYLSADPPAGGWGSFFQTPSISPVTPLEITREARAWEIGGTANYPGAVGLAAAIGLVMDCGQDRIAARIAELTSGLIDGLDRHGFTVTTPRDPAARAGIVTFGSGSAHTDAELTDYLLDAGIRVSLRYTSGIGGIRVSCHGYNTEADLELLLDALAAWRNGR